MPDVEVFNEICNRLDAIYLFLQFFIYGIFLVILVYFGYWFFSRFFY